MKKLFAMILVGVMGLSMAACGNGDAVTPSTSTSPSTSASESASTTPSESESDVVESTEPSETATEESTGVVVAADQAAALAMAPTTEATGQLTIASVTQINGDFMSGWTNAAPNARIKESLYGYDTVTMTEDIKFIYDPVVVKSHEEKMNDDGTKTFTMTIYDNLVYNDGSKITAKDYIFNLLLGDSPEFKALGTTVAGGASYIGFESFNAGYLVNDEGMAVDATGAAIEKAVMNEDGTPKVDENGIAVTELTGEKVPCKTHAGYHLIDDYTFSLTVKASELPFFYDITYALSAPMPMAVIAPGVDIIETPEGVKFTDEFTVELLQKTIMDPATGYRYKPMVTSGPYQFVSFDVNTSTSIIEANPKFLAKYDGAKAQIKTLINKMVVDATMMEELSTGQVDLLTGVNGGERITAGLDLVDAGKASYSEYPRAGYGRIAFHCDFSPTQFQNVRQAIATILDRDEFCRTYTGGYGIIVDGYYGASMWEYQENKDLLDQKLNHYTYNLETAKQLLIDDGWTKNATGGDFVEGTDEIRYKDVDGTLMALEIQWMGTAPNPVTDLINATLPAEALKVGMKIVHTPSDFSTLQANLTRTGIDKPVYSMYNLATGFATVYSPWYYYDPQYLGQYNDNFIDDAALTASVKALKETEAGDLKAWAEKWVAFQVEWNRVMPDIPLYSDMYHDFYNAKLENYRPGPLWGWSYSILRAKVAE